MKESRFNIWVDRDERAYVFNGQSGALLRVPDKDRQALRMFLAGDEGSGCSPALLERMAVGRMLVPDDADELEVLRKRYETTRYDSSHFALTIVPSLGCNFDCPYCFEAKHPSIMKPEVVEAILRVVDDQLPKIRRFTVAWFGGEPLVGRRPLLDLSDAFIARCDAAGVEYAATITTNGYLLDEKTCIDLRDRRVKGCQVCLDGPPEVHDRMRPLRSGRGTFWEIVKNLHHAVEHLDVAVRMNVDANNMPTAEKLLQILASEGFSGKLSVYVGQIVGVNDGTGAPSEEDLKRGACFRSADFARAELEFVRLATRYGFSRPTVPSPSGAPCTAVRANELIVGSTGELYKCWDSVGNRMEVVGHIREYRNLNGRLARWLKYDPFSNDECRSCIALPVCMGGCAHHAFDKLQYENRCGTFRHTYKERVLDFVEWAETHGTAELVPVVQLAQRLETR